MPLWVVGSIVLSALGFAAKQAGQGIDNASNGVLKTVIGVGGTYGVLKYFKVIK